MAPRMNIVSLMFGRDPPEIGSLAIVVAMTAKVAAAKATFFVTFMNHLYSLFRPASHDSIREGNSLELSYRWRLNLRDRLSSGRVSQVFHLCYDEMRPTCLLFVRNDDNCA